MAASIRAPFPAGTSVTQSGVSPVTLSVTVNPGDTALRCSVTVSAAADSAITVAVTANLVSPSGSSVARHSNGQTAGYVRTYWWLTPSVGTYNIVATASGGTPDGLALKAHALTGTSGAPTLTYDSNPQNTTNVTACSVTTGSTVTGDLAVGTFCSGSTFSSLNNTQQWLDPAPGGSSAATQSAGNSAAGAGSTLTLTANHALDWSAGIAEVWAQTGTAPADTDGGANLHAGPWKRVPGGVFNPVGQLLPWYGIPTSAPPPGPPLPPYFKDTATNSTPEFVANLEDWGILANATRNPNPASGGTYQTTFDNYFTAKAGQGFNAVEVSMFHTTDQDGGQNGPDGDGVFPFTGSSTNPANTRNTAWWDRRDYFFSSAQSHGFRVFCNISTQLLNAGAFTASWSTTQWQQWGTHLAAKYPASTHPHVFWIVGDDYFSTVDAGLNALRTALIAGGATQPKSIQWFQEATSRKNIWDGSDLTSTGNDWAAFADYNWGYSYNVSYDVVEKAGLEASPIPYGWMDGLFLGSGTTTITDKQELRRLVWWALSSGAKSVTIGNNSVYPWDAGAYTEATTNTFYTTTMPAILTAFRALPNWHQLQADTASLLVTGGRGTHASAIISGGGGTAYTSDADSYVTASFIQNGSNAGTLALIYMSHGSTITINESYMVSNYVATWVDPANGATSSATPGPTYNSTAKGNNSDGQADWVLVLRAPGGASTTQVTATRATTWRVLSQVTATRATTWNVKTQVTATRATTWRVLAPVTSTRATTWRVLSQATSTRATTWRVAAQVSSTRATTWRVLARATATKATTWDVLAAVTNSRATTWRVLAQTTATRATTWNVASTLAQVTATRATTWRVLAQATSSRATTWNALARTTSTRATTWDVLSAVTSSRATTWRVLARATSTRATTWNVASSLLQVTSTRATTWKVRAQVTGVTATTWDVRTVTTATRATTWDVLTTATATRATTWKVRAQATGSRATTWQVIGRITATRATTWNVNVTTLFPASTPAKRTLAITADPRTLLVTAEDRTYMVRS